MWRLTSRKKGGKAGTESERQPEEGPQRLGDVHSPSSAQHCPMGFWWPCRVAMSLEALHVRGACALPHSHRQEELEGPSEYLFQIS